MEIKEIYCVDWALHPSAPKRIVEEIIEEVLEEKEELLPGIPFN